MRTTILRPRAAALVESLRDIGYSLETAVSDIIDNSITAGATEIEIWCLGDDDPLNLAIVDNGSGMSDDVLEAAMRPGSADPRATRAAADLGRFGLGLKTASFSQARKLTVASRQSEFTAAARWDLDQIVEDDDWNLGLLDAPEISELPWIEQLKSRGTLVLWEKLDRFAESLEGESRANLVNAKLASLSKHLSLVFHRFISGDVKPRSKLEIRINGRKVPAFDPFCLDHSATQRLPVETLAVGQSRISIQAFILPHHSKLSARALEFYESRGDFLSNQGAYVYRNDRLMAWGNWFGFLPKGEATKLARVAIDFTSELDDQWTIDIKKSRAHPPPVVRARFKQLIERIAGASARVYRGRGDRTLDAGLMPMWSRIPERGGSAYAPNEDHPMLRRVLDAADPKLQSMLSQVFRHLGASMPVDAIYADLVAGSSRLAEPLPAPSREECRTKLEAIKAIVDPEGDWSVPEFIRVVASTRMFEGFEQLVESVAGDIYS